MNKLFKNLKGLNFSKHLLAYILLLAVFLRILGVYPGYALQHPDEQSILSQVYNFIINHNPEPFDYHYGLLLGYIYSIIQLILFSSLAYLLSSIVGIAHYNDLSKNMYYYIDHNHYLNYMGRYETAVISSLTVIVVYFLGKKIFNKEIGLIAAFLTAVNYRHVLSSTITLADAPAALFATLSIYLSLSILTTRSLNRYIYAAIGIALSLSVKYFVYVIPPFILCHALSVGSKDNTSFFKKIKSIILNKNLIIAFLISLSAFLLINPYLLLKYNIALKQFIWNASNYSVTPEKIGVLGNNFSLYPLYYLWNYGLGRLLSVITIIGILYGLIRYPKISLILFSSILPFFYMFVILSGKIGTVHNFSSILPIILIFPALAIYKLSKIIKMKKIMQIFLIALTITAGFPSFKNSLLSSLYYSQSQNKNVLLKWIENNTNNDSNLLHIDPVRDKSMTMQELKDLKINYAVINSSSNLFFNDQLTKNDNIMSKTFFNNLLFWKILENTYASLLTKELGNYRIKTITKPFWQSTEDSFFVVKIPKDHAIYEKSRLTNTFHFVAGDDKNWTIGNLLPTQPEAYRISRAQGHDETNGIKLSADECTIQTSFSSNAFTVKNNKWYEASGWFKHEGDISRNFKDGFLRLDFYSQNDIALKTYVSKRIDSNSWTNLSTSGISPNTSKYAKISLQIDECFKGQSYIFNNINIFTSNNKFEINKLEYPYYETDLPKNFIWSPSRYL